MAPTFSLSPATEADIPGMMEIWHKCFSSPQSLRAFPKTPVVDEWISEHWRLDMKGGDKAMLVVITADEGGKRGKVASFTSWVRENIDSKPGEAGKGIKRGPSTWQEKWLQGRDLADGMSYEAFPPLFEPMERQHGVIMEDRAHIFLEILATHPDYQRQGLASMMLKWGVEFADREEIEAYVDASAAGKPLYEKFGWKGMDHLTDADSRGIPMWRAFS